VSALQSHPSTSEDIALGVDTIKKGGVLVDPPPPHPTPPPQTHEKHVAKVRLILHICNTLAQHLRNFF